MTNGFRNGGVSAGASGGSRLWLRAVMAIFVSVAVFGLYVRFASLQDVFCKSPDELAEMMPGLRLHALPVLNLRDPVRFNFIQSMFYSQHGLGDVSFYYLWSSVLPLLGLPISERWLFAASGVTNLALALAGGVFGARLLGSAATGWVFAILTLGSPFYVMVSRTGWGRLTWTPLLLLLLFMSQYKAMRDRQWRWCALFIVLAGFIALTDGFVFLPLMGVLAFYVHDGDFRTRARRLVRDPVLWAAIGASALGATVDVLVGLEARRRGTNLTMIAYLLFKGGRSAIVPSQTVLSGWARAVDWYLPFRGMWIVVTAAFVLAAVKGLRGHLVGVVAAWWLLAALGVLRYTSGLEAAALAAHRDFYGPGSLNVSMIAVPSFLLVAWLVAGLFEGRLFAAWPPWMTSAIAAASLVALVVPAVPRAYAVAFRETLPSSNCRAIKAAAFYVRSHSTSVPYVFHLLSGVTLGHIGEFYYGLSYGRSVRPEEPNHLLDFGAHQFDRNYPPEAFYRAYGVEHFDYYIRFTDNPDRVAEEATQRLLREGARVVANIWNEGRLIAQILSFSGDPLMDLEYRTAARSWDRQFAHPRTLLLQPIAGTAYHFGYNWRPPDQ